MYSFSLTHVYQQVFFTWQNYFLTIYTIFTIPVEGHLKSVADEGKNIRIFWKRGNGVLKRNKNGHQIFATYFLNSTLHRSFCLENIFDFEGTFPLCSTICCCIKFSTLSLFKTWCGYNHIWTQFRSARLHGPQKSLCPETGHRIWLFYFSLPHLFWT